MDKRTAIPGEVWGGRHSREWIMGQDRAEGKIVRRGTQSEGIKWLCKSRRHLERLKFCSTELPVQSAAKDYANIPDDLPERLFSKVNSYVIRFFSYYEKNRDELLRKLFIYNSSFIMNLDSSIMIDFKRIFC